jgi:hypothetical protein
VNGCIHGNPEGDTPRIQALKKVAYQNGYLQIREIVFPGRECREVGPRCESRF